MDSYRTSWALYKAQTEGFTDDIDYYARFTGQHPTLELFAGFGRVANPLLERGVPLETVEINADFAKSIRLPPERSHVCDVLDFIPAAPVSRVFAAYNSFCLLREEALVERFFAQVGAFLCKGGQASLNYYHPDYWADAVEETFDYAGQAVHYMPGFDLSERKTGLGVWIDTYHIGDEIISHRYETRIYESALDIEPFLAGTGLRLIGEIENFNNNEVKEPGWIDFLLEKY